jgi:DNA-directed RNA polymerase subunit RPC12/RpoP
MSKRRQRPIPVTDRERTFLEQQRALYQSAVGDTGDWGEFLKTAALLGLVGLGLYKLAQIAQRSGRSVSVACPTCTQPFLMALPMAPERYQQVDCPHCQAQLVVDLAGRLPMQST